MIRSLSAFESIIFLSPDEWVILSRKSKIGLAAYAVNSVWDYSMLDIIFVQGWRGKSDILLQIHQSDTCLKRDTSTLSSVSRFARSMIQ